VPDRRSYSYRFVDKNQHTQQVTFDVEGGDSVQLQTRCGTENSRIDAAHHPEKRIGRWVRIADAEAPQEDLVILLKDGLAA
jgi:hypothetical protein